MRILLETQALERYIPNLPPEDIEEVRDVRARILDLGRRDDERYWPLHKRLHFACYEKCGSPWLLSMVETLWSHTERHRRLAARIIEFGTDLGNDLHGDIIDHIAAGEVREAVTSLEHDLSRISDLVASAYAKKVPS